MLRPLAFLLVAVTFSAVGELLLKHGMNKVGVLSLQPEQILPSLLKVFTTPPIVLGFSSIFLGSIFWLAVISRVPLSYAYPMLSTSYVIVVVASWLLLGEQLTQMRIAGVLVICAGVAIVSRS
ncbi:MAG: multidrug resistance protein [Dehalococcoidia bacterium]|nr:multidrug resistance protein [Dehalococcoidia bacterium]